MEMVVKIRTTHQQEQRMLTEVLQAISRLDYKHKPSDLPVPSQIADGNTHHTNMGTRKGWTLTPEQRKRMAQAQQKRRRAEKDQRAMGLVKAVKASRSTQAH